MSEELFDIVDEHDCVIGQMPRSQVHSEHQLHRAVHIFVFNSDGQLLIHRRSAQKDEHPDKWTSSASGHLSAGEAYEESAHREMQEEIGLAGELEFLHKFPATPETSYEHTVLYRMTCDKIPTFDPGEIAEGTYCPVAQINAQMETDPDRFAPAFRVLFRWYFQYFG